MSALQFDSDQVERQLMLADLDRVGQPRFVPLVGLGLAQACEANLCTACPRAWRSPTFL